MKTSRTICALLILLPLAVWMLTPDPAPSTPQIIRPLEPSAPASRERVTVAPSAPAPRVPQVSLTRVDRARGEVRRLAAKLEFDEDLEERVKTAAQSLTAADCAELARVAVEANAPSDEKFNAVHLLTLVGPAAIPALGEVVAAPFEIPGAAKAHSLAEVRQRSESTVRLTALEALDRLAREGHDVHDLLVAAEAAQTDPTLKMLARFAIEGVQSGKPGRLGQILQAALNEAAGRE